MTTKEGSRLTQNINNGRFRSPDDIAPARRLATDYMMQVFALEGVLAANRAQMGEKALQRRVAYIDHLRTRIKKVETLLFSTETTRDR